MSNYNTIESELARLNNRIGSLSVNAGTLRTSASFSGTIDANIVGGTLTGANPSDGTLRTVTQIGTLPDVVIGSGTLQTLNAGTLQYVGAIGTLPNVTVASMPTVTVQWSNQNVGVSDGTLRAITEIGTLPNVTVGSGTLAVSSLPSVTVGAMPTTTVQWSNQTVAISEGTLRTVTQVGTLPNITVGSGTLQAIAGNVNVVDVGLGTCKVSDGTVKIDLTTAPSGTLKVNVVAGGAGGGAAQLEVTDSAGNYEKVGLGTYRCVPVEGTVSVGNLNVSSGTLTLLGTVTKIDTLPNVVVGSGTLQAVAAITNAVTVTWGLGTTNPSAGTLDTVTKVGTLPNIVIGSGTIQTINNGTISAIGTLPNITVASMPTTTVQWSNQTIGVTDGTLRAITQVGTLPNVVIDSGTLQAISGNVGVIPQSGTLQQVTLIPTVTSITNPVTVTWGLGTANPTAGTLDTVTRVGTLPNVVVGSGTLQAISGNVPVIAQSGTLQAITNIAGFSATVGTLGTLNTVTRIGTVYNVGTLSSGTLQYIGAIGTLPTSNCGTVYYQNNLGTVYYVVSVGSVNTYAPHDKQVYDNIGTIMTAVGTLVQTASRIIKVHQFSVFTDGTLGWSFNNIKPNGGTLYNGGYFTQREGIVQPFIPYPGYHFKTTTVGSALCLGTYATGMSGTAYIHLVYTDDDTT